MRKGIVSVTLDPQVKTDGQILAALNDHPSFSDFVNFLIQRETEIEQYRINEFKRIQDGTQARISQPVRT